MPASPYDLCSQERDRLLDKVAALEAELAEVKQREADAWQCCDAERTGRLEALAELGLARDQRNTALRERDEARAALAVKHEALEVAVAQVAKVSDWNEKAALRIRELEAERDALREVRDTAGRYVRACRGTSRADPDHEFDALAAAVQMEEVKRGG